MKHLLLYAWMLASTAALWAQAQTPANAAPKAAQAARTTPVAVAKITQPFKGDLDALVKRRLIRVLTPYSKTGFFVHNGVTRGLVCDSFRQFETDLNLKLKTRNPKVIVMVVPAPYDKLEQYLLEGRGDIVAATALITDQRLQHMDFTNPTGKDVAELIVTGPGGPEIATLEDLSGKTLFVSKLLPYRKDMEELSARFVKEGKAPLKLLEAPDNFGTEDMLEMVNAGIVPATVAHGFLAEFGAQVMPKLKVNKAAAVKTGGQVASAIRKDRPKLKAELNAFLAKYPEGGAFRSALLASYLKSTKFAKAATSPAERARLEKLQALFIKYGDKYEMDYLLMAAQGYQESGLNHSARSPAGAIGVMQVMPATGKELKVGDINQIEANIHAGVKFIRFMMDKYYGTETEITTLNKGLFTFAAYNCGPGRIAQLRKLTAARGLDPNVWFNNVEILAAEKIGRETVTYVSNIYKYYIGYKLLKEQSDERNKVKETLRNGAVNQ